MDLPCSVIDNFSSFRTEIEQRHDLSGLSYTVSKDILVKPLHAEEKVMVWVALSFKGILLKHDNTITRESCQELLEIEFFILMRRKKAVLKMFPSCDLSPYLNCLSRDLPSIH